MYIKVHQHLKYLFHIEIIHRYKDTCAQKHISPIADKSLLKPFPNINKCRTVINGSREVIYLGVEWKTLPSRTYIDQTDRNNLLNPKYQCLILKHSNDCNNIDDK